MNVETDDNSANIMLSRKFSMEKKLIRRMFGNKKVKIIMGTMKARIAVRIMNERYAVKAIFTPPFFSSLWRSSKYGKSP